MHIYYCHYLLRAVLHEYKFCYAMYFVQYDENVNYRKHKCLMCMIFSTLFCSRLAPWEYILMPNYKLWFGILFKKYCRNVREDIWEISIWNCFSLPDKTYRTQFFIICRHKTTEYTFNTYFVEPLRAEISQVKIWELQNNEIDFPLNIVEL